MKLTIIGPENIYEQEVNPSMEVQDVVALIAVDAEIDPDTIFLSTDSGQPLTNRNKTLESHGLTSDSTLFFTVTNPASASSSSSAGPSTQALAPFPDDADEVERMRLTALGNPQFMNELRRHDPEMAQAVTSGERFREEFMKLQVRLRQEQLDKNRMIEALNDDPYDVEAQKKIEEAIRREAVMENMQHAMEYSPESFGSVIMLYVNMEINGHSIKAFVDSGAQSTIINPETAERCGIMRLLDTQFAGIAMGVGTARILGRVHSVQVKLGDLYLPCAFSVMEGRTVDVLLGLDMLKRHQCNIDLAANVLRIGKTEIPFLAEHELPDKARIHEAEEVAGEMGQAAGEGVNPVATGSTTGKQAFPGSGNTLGGNTSAGPSSAGGSGQSAAASRPAIPSSASHPEASVQTLIGLGSSRAQAIQLLDACGGNVDAAASMLFG